MTTKTEDDEWILPWSDEVVPDTTPKPTSHPTSNWNDDDDLCPVCNQEVIGACGPKNSPILIVGDYPGKEELSQGTVMVGQMGGVLRNELSFVKIDLRRCRRMNLWQHPPTVATKKKNIPFIYDPDGKPVTCYDIGFQAVVDEAQNRSSILLIGADTVKAFTGKGVMEVNGLLVKAPSLPDIPIVACLNPAIVFHSTVGELRFALKNFSKIAEGLL